MIESRNPVFTQLLLEQDPEGVVRQKWAVYSTADDRLPSYASFAVPVVEVAVCDLWAPGDKRPTGKKWPNRKALPIIAVPTGSIPVYKI
jgi:hypothetical protein